MNKELMIILKSLRYSDVNVLHKLCIGIGPCTYVTCENCTLNKQPIYKCTNDIGIIYLKLAEVVNEQRTTSNT